MVETLKLSLCVEMTMNINCLLYFLKRLPFLKKWMRNVGYEHNSVAKGFVTLSIIYETLKMILKVGTLVLLGIVFPILFVKHQYQGVRLEDVYYQLYLFFYIILPLALGNILSPSPRKFICVKVMKMKARSYVIADYLPQDILRLLIESVFFYFVAKGFGFRISLVMLLLVAKHFYAIAYEGIHVAYYQARCKFIHKSLGLVLIYLFLVLGAGYSLVLLNLILPFTSLGIVLIALVGILAGIVLGLYLIRYPYFDIAFNKANRLADLTIDKKKVKAEAEFRQVKLKENDLSSNPIVQNFVEKKSGYEYLNAIFFQRHRRILIRPILIQLGIITVVFVVGIIVLIVSNEVKQGLVEELLKRFPVVIFVSYCMSTGLKSTKAMFYNCDLSLLRYGFYRQGHTVLTTFSLRVRYVILSNLLPAFYIAIVLFVLEMLAGGSGRALLPVGLLVITMSIFFSVHNMMLYYLLQPYTSDLNVKNPAFTVINIVTYILSYACLQMETAPQNFLFYTVVGTAIYVILAFILVYLLAPKTFTVK